MGKSSNVSPECISIHFPEPYGKCLVCFPATPSKNSDRLWFPFSSTLLTWTGNTDHSSHSGNNFHDTTDFGFYLDYAG